MHKPKLLQLVQTKQTQKTNSTNQNKTQTKPPHSTTLRGHHLKALPGDCEACYTPPRESLRGRGKIRVARGRDSFQMLLKDLLGSGKVSPFLFSIRLKGWCLFLCSLLFFAAPKSCLMNLYYSSGLFDEEISEYLYWSCCICGHLAYKTTSPRTQHVSEPRELEWAGPLTDPRG